MCICMCIYVRCNVCQGGLREALELQIREEVSAEFMELFERMEKDYRCKSFYTSTATTILLLLYCF